jgi:hypothetical protein
MKINLKVKKRKDKLLKTPNLCILIISNRIKLEDLFRVYNDITINRSDAINENMRVDDLEYSYSKEENIIKIDSIRNINKRRQDISFYLSSHFLLKFLVYRIDINLLLDVYEYVKDNIYINNNKEIELTNGNSTIIFKQKYNKVEIVTAWEGLRDTKKIKQLEVREILAS